MKNLNNLFNNFVFFDRDAMKEEIARLLWLKPSVLTAGIPR